MINTSGAVGGFVFNWGGEWCSEGYVTCTYVNNLCIINNYVRYVMIHMCIYVIDRGRKGGRRELIMYTE